MSEPSPVRQAVSGIKRRVKQTVRSPFADRRDRRLIVHCSHHRAGSTWLTRVLSAIAGQYGLKYERCFQEELTPAADVFVQNHGVVDPTKLPPYRGSHLIRDPRDIVVSGYFYHLWTEEKWAHVPRPEYGNRSYQAYLNSVSQADGLLAEMRRFAEGEKALRQITQWNYRDPDFIEVRYEDLIADEVGVFRRIFEHFGFNESAIETSLGIAEEFSFERQTRRKVGEVQSNAHLRSGRSGQWRDIFEEEHVLLGKELLGDALVKLGYETDRSW